MPSSWQSLVTESRCATTRDDLEVGGRKPNTWCGSTSRACGAMVQGVHVRVMGCQISDWIERYIAERMREQEERVRIRQLKKVAQQTRRCWRRP